MQPANGWISSLKSFKIVMFKQPCSVWVGEANGSQSQSVSGEGGGWCHLHGIPVYFFPFTCHTFLSNAHIFLQLDVCFFNFYLFFKIFIFRLMSGPSLFDSFGRGEIEEEIIFFLNYYQFIVDLQCCVNFWCTAKLFTYTFLHTLFSIVFSIALVTGYWLWFPVLTAGPCSSILCIIVCVC